jgi:hypothetical protein
MTFFFFFALVDNRVVGVGVAGGNQPQTQMFTETRLREGSWG